MSDFFSSCYYTLHIWRYERMLRRHGIYIRDAHASPCMRLFTRDRALQLAEGANPAASFRINDSAYGACLDEIRGAGFTVERKGYYPSRRDDVYYSMKPPEGAQ